MEEIFELISAFNRLKEKIGEISTKIDLLLKSVAQYTGSDYPEEYSACKFLDSLYKEKKKNSPQES